MRAVLFDFFGTLVTYERNRLKLDYPATAVLVHGWGYENAGERFAEVWDGVSRTLELSTGGSLAEFSMHDVVTAYDDAEQLGLTSEQRAELLRSFMNEWRVGVRPIDGVHAMLAEVSSRVPIGIVSNTHDAALVPRILERFELDALFDPMVLSVVHGHRKPHPSIYAAAFDALTARASGALSFEPADVLFVGDTYLDDYAGPVAAGFQARLIDPDRRHPVPDDHRLKSIFELPHHL